jgi:hypothetical protein
MGESKSEKWFQLIDAWCKKYLDLRNLSHNEKLALAICLSTIEQQRETNINEIEEELFKLSSSLINSSKINSNALRDAGKDLFDILSKLEKV